MLAPRFEVLVAAFGTATLCLRVNMVGRPMLSAFAVLPPMLAEVTMEGTRGALCGMVGSLLFPLLEKSAIEGNRF